MRDVVCGNCKKLSHCIKINTPAPNCSEYKGDPLTEDREMDIYELKKATWGINKYLPLPDQSELNSKINWAVEELSRLRAELIESQNAVKDLSGAIMKEG